MVQCAIHYPMCNPLCNVQFIVYCAIHCEMRNVQSIEQCAIHCAMYNSLCNAQFIVQCAIIVQLIAKEMARTFQNL